MKFALLFILLFTSVMCYSQDSTFRCNGKYVEVKRKGISNIHSVEGVFKKEIWIKAKVKRVNYEYTYKRTYHGSTQPANPTEFYKPIKAKSFYYTPMEDVMIKYARNGQIYQSLSMDSLTLRTYREDRTIKEIIYLNEDLQADSIFRFYENGNLKTKIIGGTNQPENNLELSLNYNANILLRKRPSEWKPDYRFNVPLYFSDTKNVSAGPSYPTKQYYCHGNGEPQIVITWVLDSTDSKIFHQEYEFFDPEGNVMGNTRMTERNKWEGNKYTYFKSGVLESRRESAEIGEIGKFELWNRDGTRKYIEYRSKSNSKSLYANREVKDSIIFFKQLKDTLFTWRPPMNFEWNRFDTVVKVEHRHFKLQFKHDGSLYTYDGEGVRGNTERKDKDDRLNLDHFGSKDELGFPHGTWLGINKFNDTIYEVNYQHGRLHGFFRVNGDYWPGNWTRNYDMGLEIDSSIRMHDGNIHDIYYFSEPGKLVKKAAYMFGDGRLSSIDTTLNGRTFFHLLKMDYGGWVKERSKVDSVNEIIYSQYYFAKDSLDRERWTNYYGGLLELKTYHHSTGKLETHWKDNGSKKVLFKEVPENSESSENLPKHKVVKLATKWYYDENGIFIRKESLENGIVVE